MAPLGLLYILCFSIFLIGLHIYKLKQIDRDTEQYKMTYNIKEKLSLENLKIIQEYEDIEFFNWFVNTGQVPNVVLQAIAIKIIHKCPLSKEDLAVYKERNQQIESIISQYKTK